MKIDKQIEVNKFGQGLIQQEELVNIFNQLDTEEKRLFIVDLIDFIIQSKVIRDDIDPAIVDSKLKPSFTPCVLIKKGELISSLYKIAQLPEDELLKVFKLFVNLFKIGYKRRFEREKDDPNKWWYWDLTNKSKVEKIKKMY